jgi:coenzyme F420-reducing hydrogenase alpha subunit
LDGVVDDPAIEKEITKSACEFLKTLNIEERNMEILHRAFDVILKCTP